MTAKNFFIDQEMLVRIQTPAEESALEEILNSEGMTLFHSGRPFKNVATEYPYRGYSGEELSICGYRGRFVPKEKRISFADFISNFISEECDSESIDDIQMLI